MEKTYKKNIREKPAPLKTLAALLVLLAMLGFISPAAPGTFLETTPKVQAAEGTAVYSLDKLEEILFEALHGREQNINIRFVGDTEQMQEELPGILESILHDDDYLRYSIRSWRWRWTGVPGDIKIDFLFEHMSTADEDEFVREEVQHILEEILSPGMHDHQVVKTVHDYIVASVAYDTSYEEYSAYAALSKGKAVCQGYALLAYKMLDQAGVENRIISGEAGDENHAWNLVRIDGSWYHLDCTWNSPAPDVPGRVQYSYYNRTDEEMRDTHTWEQDEYPAANTSYQPPENIQMERAIITDYAGERWPAHRDTPADKTWTVRFNQRINPRSVTDENIFIADPDANLLNIQVNPGDDGRSAVISPEGSYPGGETYYLLISREIISQGGNGLKSPAWMEFSVP